MPELINRTTGVVVATDARFATAFFARLVGLIGLESFPTHCALGITPCGQVHTFGVRFPLELAFCDVTGQVLDTQALAPRRISRRVPGAVIVWEAAEGALLPHVQIGATLCLV